MYSSPTVLGTFAVDSRGSLAADSLIPCGKEVGQHRVVATGRDASGRVVSTTLEITVNPGGCRPQVAGVTSQNASATRPNARTGAQAQFVVQLSMLLIACGAGTMFLGWRFRANAK
jgi:hypothetical protein